MKAFLKNVGLVLVSLVLGFFGAPVFGYLYNNFLQAGFGGGFFGTASSLEFIVGMPISFVFFLVVFFLWFGDQSKYWWAGIGVLGLLALAFYLDPQNIVFPTLTVLIGAGLGWGAKRVYTSLKK